MTKIAVSFLSGKETLTNTIKKIEATDCDYLHVDIMDGKFVKNKTYTFGEIKKITKYTRKPLDVHLMVSNPLKYINDYAMLDVKYLTFHYEAVKDPQDVINEIKMTGIKCGMSIKPTTKIDKVIPFLKDLDLILIMSVNPGKGGQDFKPDTYLRIRTLREKIEELGLNTKISVDGGINEVTGRECIMAGADMLVSGSFITNSDNYQLQFEKLKNK